MCKRIFQNIQNHDKMQNGGFAGHLFFISHSIALSHT